MYILLEEELVTVIMPTYNRAEKIMHSIKSVLNQTYEKFELLIIDDFSEDNTKQLIEEIMRVDDRVHYFVNQRRKGPAGARNTGIINSEGKYLSFLDSDDIWYSNHLENCIQYMKMQQVKMSCALWEEKKQGKINRIDDASFYEQLNSVLKETENCVCKYGIVFYKYFLENSLVYSFYCYHINTIVIEKEILKNIGFFNEKLMTSEDVDFVFRLLAHQPFILIKEYHFVYCDGDDNLYSYIDRAAISINELEDNPVILSKFLRDGKHKNIMRTNLYRSLKRERDLGNRKACLHMCKNRISRKYFTLAYLEKKRINKIQMLLKSLFYDYDIKIFKYFISTILKLKNKIVFERKDFDFD